ncbi:uncharacterized protein BP5553_05749 [Venustampulla echinocandica]|uniref:F-box domain-containing protein n=1 Tax=Venustampulla echinocandica TaxID=2656787 RepID=A0A370TLM3_9HELO|nr:uncharacterized protein BP5553_05749 [Venustampulla echinocandica]RDL36397.1 hypothetical protein BP5553_05749 [Venustampulla echinocandica]
MKKWFRRKKSRGFEIQRYEDKETPRFLPPYYAPPATDQVIAKLPISVLQNIFFIVCAHTRDETYETCEQSATDDLCPLCDLRDLAHCAQVSRKWRSAASPVLYHSIRIDAVHYCKLEGILADRRRRGRIDHNAMPEDVPAVRLRLLARTLRDQYRTSALSVQYLKTPYMVRETCKPDLARCVSVCTNLRYIDLPDGCYTNDPSCDTLRQEVQGRCPDIRKMTYMGGSEANLELLVGGRLWRNLEVMELSKLDLDPRVIRQALGSLQYLRALKVTNMRSFDDKLLQHSEFLPPFPPVTELIFEYTPSVTPDGLAAYLQRPDTQNALKTLSLKETGVHPSTLQRILAIAPRLQHLSIVEDVKTSLPTGVPPLSSKSLRTFHYEITSAASASSYTSTAPSYYSYLASSLLSNGLPNLRELYVRDANFPESLIDLAPPIAPFACDPDNFSPQQSPNPRFSSNNPFANVQSGQGLRQELQVFSKGLDEMEWNIFRVQPPTAPGRRGSVSEPRPISSYGLGENMDLRWGQGTGARRSVIVGNGFGGFLAVPSDDGQRPSSSAGEKKRGSQYDMWR